MANRWLPSMPATLSGVCLTSRKRPSDGLAVALLFLPVPSGVAVSARKATATVLGASAVKEDPIAFSEYA
jgi:hypothetical protein